MKYIKKIPLFMIVGILSIIALFPFYIMLIMGTYVNEDLFTGIKLLPGNYLINNLNTVFSRSFLGFYLNSLYIAVVVSVEVLLYALWQALHFPNTDLSLKAHFSSSY